MSNKNGELLLMMDGLSGIDRILNRDVIEQRVINKMQQIKEVTLVIGTDFYKPALLLITLSTSYRPIWTLKTLFSFSYSSPDELSCLHKLVLARASLTSLPPNYHTKQQPTTSHHHKSPSCRRILSKYSNRKRFECKSNGGRLQLIRFSTGLVREFHITT